METMEWPSPSLNLCPVSTLRYYTGCCGLVSYFVCFHCKCGQCNLCCNISGFPFSCTDPETTSARLGWSCRCHTTQSKKLKASYQKWFDGSGYHRLWDNQLLLHVGSGWLGWFFSLKKWKNHLKTPLNISSGYLCLIKTWKRDKKIKL